MNRELIATYRLQLNAGFTLHDALERVPYLHALGISHVYCSPVLAARRGSTHGYDVADPTQVSEELGGEAALRRLADALHQHGMRRRGPAPPLPRCMIVAFPNGGATTSTSAMR